MKLFVLAVVALLIATSQATNRIEYEFALQFVSQSEGDSNVARATSQRIETLVSNGPRAKVTALNNNNGSADNNQAVWLSALAGQAGKYWREVGNITFGNSGTILFESNGYSGVQIGNFADLNYGAITYKITSGTGQYVGAYGMMTDMFISTDPSNDSAPFNIEAAGHFWIDQN
jgi:hypothetical protein